MGGPERWEAVRRAVAIGLCAVLLLGCTDSFPWSVHIPDDLRTPTIAGVVESSEQVPDGRWIYELQGGQTLDVHYDETESLLGGPDVGYLLLFGTDADGKDWVAGVPLNPTTGRPVGCYELVGQGRAAGEWIETEGGFRLPKAVDFVDDRDNPDELFTSDRGVFCLNARGEVFHYSIA